ncbi:5-(carboxyamino)imidazole ribonucleotide synthase [Actibacterium sp. 188UL27-1]|uniref:5-(carboxyamino)imidazole ribonucleotide synthase n=1 Tax=Actibacterium sp. 188UL27-1 TaxID=2786961 RepID=UPI0019581F1F|nr:5-(carboxyamino)imidazole ribonucleotide synthase [Actibacterium sp. 188UL27-1]MBM7068084.1 5-(carboxyamino)imidazole ribonucleotide synthase [Actibacterium sp. 188UL27-1]
MTPPLPPGSTIGILGGGQLGRMLSVAAARLGYRCHIFEPDAAPAGDVAAKVTTAAYSDADAIAAFAKAVDVVTFEFENIPLSSLEALARLSPLRPGIAALDASQDRLVEKTRLRALGLQTAPFAQVDDLAGLRDATGQIGSPAILKTRRMGYDGKGQVRITEHTDLAQAWDSLQGAPAILEGFVDFRSEVSVIAARGLDGAVSCFDPGENVHRDGILRTTTVPARITSGQRSDAVLIAAKILNTLDYVGVLGVELFVTPGGLIVNEIAPRVHNSGHWTQNGCAIDQFEQHIRAIAGWPLGDGTRHADVVMENLIGDDMDRLPHLAAQPNVALHLYGKAETRPGRKMGHVNRTAIRA